MTRRDRRFLTESLFFILTGDTYNEDNIIEYKQPPSSEEIIQTINELIQAEHFFSHLIVNGVEVYEEPESYLFEELYKCFNDMPEVFLD